MVNDYVWLTKNTKKRYTLGVVYPVGEVDKQGDSADAGEVEKAAWTFLTNLQQRHVAKAQVLEGIIRTLVTGQDSEIDITNFAKAGVGDQHQVFDPSLGTVVESYCAPVDFTLNGQHIPAGSWCMGVIWSPEMFQKIERGERRGYSMGGSARRV